MLLLILFVGLAVLYWMWKASYGVIGHVTPLDFGPQGSSDHIMFLRQDAAGAVNLFTINADGTDEKQRTDDGTPKHGAAWSPDATQICYCGEVRDEGGAAYQLFRLDKNGPKQATHGTGSKSQPRWRPDGKQIAFIVGGAIKVVSPNGSDMEQVYPRMHKVGPGGEESEEQDSSKAPPVAAYDWAPGKAETIAGVLITEAEEGSVQGRGNWWKKPANSSGAQPAAPAGPEPETLFFLRGMESKPERPRMMSANKVGFGWFPDGTRLAVTLSSRGNEHGLIILNADEPNLEPKRVYVSRTYSIAPENPSVSPDGTRIAFEAWRMDSPENRELLGIAVLPLDGTQTIQLSSASEMSKLPLPIRGRATAPRWSPDGTRLLYQVMDTSGKRDLWVSKADGSGAVNLTKGKGDCFDASWSPRAK